MITLHGKEVRVGDKVWNLLRGWGEVIQLYNDNHDYPICVIFEGFWERYTKEGSRYIESKVPTLLQWNSVYEWFTEDGKLCVEDNIPILFWQPTEFEIPEKPKKEKAWRWVYRDSYTELLWVTSKHYSSVDDFYSKYPKSSHRAIEPLLSSEIERNIGEEE